MLKAMLATSASKKDVPLVSQGVFTKLIQSQAQDNINLDELVKQFGCLLSESDYKEKGQALEQMQAAAMEFSDVLKGDDGALLETISDKYENVSTQITQANLQLQQQAQRDAVANQQHQEQLKAQRVQAAKFSYQWAEWAATSMFPESPAELEQKAKKRKPLETIVRENVARVKAERESNPLAGPTVTFDPKAPSWSTTSPQYLAELTRRRAAGMPEDRDALRHVPNSTMARELAAQQILTEYTRQNTRAHTTNTNGDVVIDMPQTVKSSSEHGDRDGTVDRDLESGQKKDPKAEKKGCKMM